jgi:hypothetical protein
MAYLTDWEGERIRCISFLFMVCAATHGNFVSYDTTADEDGAMTLPTSFLCLYRYNHR